MSLTQLRQQIEGDLLLHAEELGWPRVELADVGRRGYLTGVDAWRGVCPALSLSELRSLKAVLTNRSAHGARISGEAEWTRFAELADLAEMRSLIQLLANPASSEASTAYRDAPNPSSASRRHDHHDQRS